MEEDEFAVKWYRTTQIQRSFLLKNDESYLNKRIILIYTFFILHIKILEWCYTYVCKIPVKHGHTQNKWEKMRNKRGLCRLEQRQQYDPVRMCWCEKKKNQYFAPEIITDYSVHDTECSLSHHHPAIFNIIFPKSFSMEVTSLSSSLDHLNLFKWQTGVRNLESL